MTSPRPTARRAAQRLPVLACFLLTACTGLSHTLHRDVEAPLSVAVLPVAGDAPAPVKDLARGLLHARLREHGFAVAEPDFVDQRLAERGLLTDPDAFVPANVPVADFADELGVDAVLLVEDCSQTSWNAVIVRRESLSMRARMLRRDGREWWRAQDTVGETGGLLLKSGQVLTEIGAQGVHGAGTAAVDRVDELTAAFAATWPEATMAASTPSPLAAPRVTAARLESSPDGTRRLVVEAEGDASIAAFELEGVGPVPMARNGASHTGAVDLPDGVRAEAVRVHARGAFGQMQHSAGEVRR